MKQYLQIESLTPLSENIHFDIMNGDRFAGQVTLKLTPGIEYKYNELESFVRMKRPSLGKDIRIIPTGQAVFR